MSIAKIVLEPKFNILDEVYHVTPESPKGVVIDLYYEHSSGLISYRVAFGHEKGDSDDFYEHELSNEKTF